jgi:hypothetical protein
LKKDLTKGSETSAKLNLTPGKYPKKTYQVSEQGENLKSRRLLISVVIFGNQKDCARKNSLESADIEELGAACSTTGRDKNA